MKAHGFRVLLIRLGKLSPFLITFLVFISYSESLVALMMNNLAEYNGEVVLYKPISWTIAKYFEYDLYMVILLLVLSIAIEACIFNKLAIAYLFIQLLEKVWLQNVELEMWAYYMIVVLNVIISLYLTLRGLKNVNSM